MCGWSQCDCDETGSIMGLTRCGFRAEASQGPGARCAHSFAKNANELGTRSWVVSEKEWATRPFRTVETVRFHYTYSPKSLRFRVTSKKDFRRDVETAAQFANVLDGQGALLA